MKEVHTNIIQAFGRTINPHRIWQNHVSSIKHLEEEHITIINEAFGRTIHNHHKRIIWRNITSTIIQAFGRSIYPQKVWKNNKIFIQAFGRMLHHHPSIWKNNTSPSSKHLEEPYIHCQLSIWKNNTSPSSMKHLEEPYIIIIGKSFGGTSHPHFPSIWKNNKIIIQVFGRKTNYHHSSNLKIHQSQSSKHLEEQPHHHHPSI